jgi:mannose-1-phosphate guanylyltransferase
MGVPTTAMIVAGGRGTRLLPLTRTTPKPMLPFCGAPMLAGLARRLGDAGVRRVLLVVGADVAPFAPLAPLLAPHGISVDIVPEPAPLDTAGGVRLASLALDEPYLVLNGDVLSDLDVAALALAHTQGASAATIALTRVDDTSAFGVCVLEGTRITAFVEKPAPGTLPGQDAINAGAYVLEPGVLARFPDGPLSFERTVFPQLLAEGLGITGHVTAGVWSDLGTPERLLEGQRLVLDGAVTWPVLDALAEDPERPGVRLGSGTQVSRDAELRVPVVLGDGVVVEAGAIVGPYVVAAEGVRIAGGARVHSSLLDRGAALGVDVEVRDTLVGAGSVVGEGAVLTDLTVVGPDVTVPPHTRASGQLLDGGTTGGVTGVVTDG